MVFPRLSSEMSFCVWRRASAPADCVPPPGGRAPGVGAALPGGNPGPGAGNRRPTGQAPPPCRRALRVPERRRTFRFPPGARPRGAGGAGGGGAGAARGAVTRWGQGRPLKPPPRELNRGRAEGSPGPRGRGRPRGASRGRRGRGADLEAQLGRAQPGLLRLLAGALLAVLPLHAEELHRRTGSPPPAPPRPPPGLPSSSSSRPPSGLCLFSVAREREKNRERDFFLVMYFLEKNTTLSTRGWEKGPLERSPVTQGQKGGRGRGGGRSGLLVFEERDAPPRAPRPPVCLLPETTPGGTFSVSVSLPKHGQLVMNRQGMERRGALYVPKWDSPKERVWPHPSIKLRGDPFSLQRKTAVLQGDTFSRSQTKPKPNIIRIRPVAALNKRAPAPPPRAGGRGEAGGDGGVRPGPAKP